MNAEKFKAAIAGLKSLIDDYNTCKNIRVRLEIEEMIVAQAELLVDEYCGEPAEKKSEMPCNCVKDKNADRIAQATKAFEDFIAAMNKIG